MPTSRIGASILLLVALTAAPSAGADGPAAAAPKAADLARALRSARADERETALAAAARLGAPGLREVLVLAGALPGDAQAWARVLLPQARAAREPQRREWVRALVEARGAARAARARAPAAVAPLPFGASWTIDLRLFQARGAALAALVGPAAPARTPRVLDDAGLARALAAPGEGSSAESLGEPTLALVGAVDAAFALTRERTYVERYEVKPGGSGRPVVSPVVDTYEEGVRCSASALTVPGAGASFRVHVDLLEAAEPLDEFDAPLVLPGRADELVVRVQIPDVGVATLERSLPLVRDLWTLVGAVAPPISKDAGSVVVLARARPAPGTR